MTMLLTEPDKVGTGREGYYFAENGEYLHYDLTMVITKALFELGAINSDEPVRFLTEEEVQAGALKVRRFYSGTQEISSLAWLTSGAILWCQRNERARPQRTR